MTGRRRIAALVAALILPGCASATEAPRATPTGAAGTGTTPPSGPSLSPAQPLSPAASRCPTPGATVIPDGAWDGPLRLRVGTVAGVPATRSTGTGRLQVLVQDGRVVQGVWNLTGRSVGQGAIADGQATVRLDARIAGTVRGPATRPILRGAWAVFGTVRITSPVTATVPVAASGEGDSAMTVRAGGCDTVTGTFAPPAAGKDPVAGLSAAARWVGRRQG